MEMKNETVYISEGKRTNYKSIDKFQTFGINIYILEEGEDKQKLSQDVSTNYFPYTQKGTAIGAQLRAWTHFPR